MRLKITIKLIQSNGNLIYYNNEKPPKIFYVADCEYYKLIKFVESELIEG